MHRGIRHLSWLICAPLATSTAYGNGACEKGYRDTTDAERQTMTMVLETARAALAPAPEGWVIGGYGDIYVASSLCRDAEATPWPYNFARIYNRAEGYDARRAAFREASTAFNVAQSQTNARTKAFMAKLGPLSAERSAAAERGDNVRADVLNVEIYAIAREFERTKAINERNTRAQWEAAAVEYTRDREITISIGINPAIASSGPDARSVNPPAGSQAAWRWSSFTFNDALDVNNAPMDNVLVLLGSWQSNAEGGMQHGSRAGADPSAAHAIAIRVSADAGRIDSIVNAIDFDALAEALLR
jgi:hypothetical protein